MMRRQRLFPGEVSTMRSTSTRLLIAVLASIVPGVAWAHVGVGETSGFAHGFFHPITGVDHVLAMVAVGMFAANLGGRALWAVPLTFVGVMAVGGALGIGGIEIPFVETGIAVSVIVLGAAVALRGKWPVVGAMALVGLFAIFHGHAHGAEMPVDASGLEYAAGFMIATALLHAVGIGIGLGLTKVGQQHAPRLVQAGGAAMAIAGVGILTGVV
jgi:urease accessory protein